MSKNGVLKAMANPKLTIDIDGNSKPLEADLKGLTSLAKSTASVMAGAFAGLTAAFVGVSSKAIGLASDLQEIQNVVDVTFGDSAKIVNEWAKTAQDAFGISELQAKKYSSTLGAMYKSMGLTADQTLAMSTRMAGLTGDLASFYNLDHEVAFQKIQSGISGEIEPLRQLGINLSVANLEAYALAEGLETAFADMSEAEKATLRYNYILQQTADAQGDFTRTADGYANQLRSAGVELENLGKSFGELLLPVATEAVAGVRSAIDSLAVAFNNPELQQSIVTIGENLGEMMSELSEFVANVIPSVINGFSTLLENLDMVALALASVTGAFVALRAQAVLTTVVTAFINLTKAIKGAALAQNLLNIAMAANPIGLVVTAIGAVVGAITYLWNTNERFKLNFQKLWQELVYDFKQLINSLIVDINKLVATFNSVTGSNIAPLGRLDVKPQLQAIESLAFALSDLDVAKIKAEEGGIVAPDAIQDVKDYRNEINSLSTTLDSVGVSASVEDNLVGPTIPAEILAERVASEEATSQAGSIIANAITNGIQSTFDSEKSVMENIGQNLIQSLADSMLSWANTLLADTISVIANSITSGMKGALDINSPSKVFAEIGKFNMQGLAEGMSSNVGLVTGKYAGIRDGLVNAFSGVGAVGLSMAGAGGAGGGIVINNINQVPNTTVQTTQKTNASGQTEITNLIVSTVATDIARGGAISQSIDYRSSSNRRVNR